jgi:hypothetical protein
MRRLYIAVAVCLITSCNQGNDAQNATVADSVEVMAADTTSLTSNDEILDEDAAAKNYLVWNTDIDSMVITKNPEFKNSNLSIDSIIKGLNLKYREIPLEKIRLSHDTLYTQITNSEYLGEQIGSTGASSYLAEAVINLTSVKGVKFVNLNFAEGSHATPGVFTRKDFEDFKIIE